MRQRTIFRSAGCATFFVLAVIPLALFGFDGPNYGSGELQLFRPPLPSKVTPQVFRRINDWFAARIGMRNFLVRLGADLNIGLLGLSVHRNVILGKDGWLFYSDDEKRPAPEMTDFRGRLRFSGDEVRRIGNHLRMTRDALAACGKTALVVIAPNKQSIYGEKLANRVTQGRTRVDDLLDRIPPDVRPMIVDPRAAMRAAKGTAPFPLYSKTDTHWNDLGAFYAYQAVVAALAHGDRIDRPDFARLDNYEIASEPWEGGDIAVRMLSSPWRFPDDRISLRPKNPVDHTVEKDGSWIFHNPAGQGRAVLFGDSFSPQLARFLAIHFEELQWHFVALPEVRTAARSIDLLRFDGPIIAARHADVAILENVERSLGGFEIEPHQIARACE